MSHTRTRGAYAAPLGDKYEEGVGAATTTRTTAQPYLNGHHLSWADRMKQRFPILQRKRGVALVIAVMFLPLLGLLGLLALRNNNGNGGSTSNSNGDGSPPADLITSDTHFYGQSEPVYPSPEMAGSGAWSNAHSRAVTFVNQLTIKEKVNLASGVGSGGGLSYGVGSNGCAGNIAPIPRLNFSGMCLHDAGQGVRAAEMVSGFPSGIHVAASWNRDLARRRAESMGQEFRKKGVNILLGPVVGPIGRVARGGRVWEGFGADPYLSGALGYETVRGVQAQGVITSTKHFIGNEQETNRNPSGDDVASVSSNIDDQTMHEVYLWPFQDTVRAGTGNIMCSYQRLNNSYGCSNSKTQNGLLKTELGFQGAVTSDWGATHSGVASALAGMDMVMPNSDLWGDALVEAVKNGSVPEARLTDMATRIIASWYHMGQDADDHPSPGVGMPADLALPHDIVDARNPADRKAGGVLRDGAVEGHVLVKNANNSLPFDADSPPNILSIFGYSARQPDVWNYQAGGGTTAWAFGGASAYMGRDTSDGFSGLWDRDLPFTSIAPNGTLFVGGGSGAVTPALAIAPLDALLSRAADDGTAAFWDLIPSLDMSSFPDVHAGSDACLVLGNAFASEGFDRPELSDEYTDALISHVASRCSNTIVIFHNAGPRLVDDSWFEHDNVTAVLMAHLPGDQSGRALVDILYGKENPSGKLPYTVAKKADDYGNLLAPDTASTSDKFAKFPQSDFEEGGLIDYRHFDARELEPKLAFGFGMSYTQFEYSNLRIRMNDTSLTEAEFPSGQVVEGGKEDLWDVVATVTATLSNVGAVDGAEVAQLYIEMPDYDNDEQQEKKPVRVLRGFAKPSIPAGESAEATFPLTRRDLSGWDVSSQEWRLRRGTYGVVVGASSRDLRLRNNLTISTS